MKGYGVEKTSISIELGFFVASSRRKNWAWQVLTESKEVVSMTYARSDLEENPSEGVVVGR